MYEPKVTPVVGAFSFVLYGNKAVHGDAYTYKNNPNMHSHTHTQCDLNSLSDP